MTHRRDSFFLWSAATSVLSDAGGEIPSARFGGLLLHLERVVLGLFFFLHEGLPPVTTEKGSVPVTLSPCSFLFSAECVS